MKKAEELKLYAPEPKRPELDAALCMSVAEGQGVGRYIKGKVLTVAVWDKKEKPPVWRCALRVSSWHEPTAHLLQCQSDSPVCGHQNSFVGVPILPLLPALRFSMSNTGRA